MGMEAGTEEKLDIVEVSDTIMRQNRYGRRNYRNSIGIDNKRHWRGEFVADEEDVEGDEVEIGEESYYEAKRKCEEEEAEAAAYRAAKDAEAEGENDADDSDAEGDESTAQGGTDSSEPDDTDPEPAEDDVKNFFDPMQNADDVASGATDEPTTIDGDEGNLEGATTGDFEDEVGTEPDDSVDIDVEAEKAASLFDDPLKDVEGLEDVVTEVSEEEDTEDEDSDQIEDQTDADERTDTVS